MTDDPRPPIRTPHNQNLLPLPYFEKEKEKEYVPPP